MLTTVLASALVLLVAGIGVLIVNRDTAGRGDSDLAARVRSRWETEPPAEACAGFADRLLYRVFGTPVTHRDHVGVVGLALAIGVVATVPAIIAVIRIGVPYEFTLDVVLDVLLIGTLIGGGTAIGLATVWNWIDPSDTIAYATSWVWFVFGMVLIVGVVLILVGAISSPVVVVVGDSMEPTYSDGDLILVSVTEPQETTDIAVGEVVVIDVPERTQQQHGFPDSIVHRVTEVNHEDGTFETAGDNSGPDPFATVPADVDGEVITSVPAVGNLFRFLQSPQGLVFIVATGVIYLYYVVLPRALQRLRQWLRELIREETVEAQPPRSEPRTPAYRPTAPAPPHSEEPAVRPPSDAGGRPTGFDADTDGTDDAATSADTVADGGNDAARSTTGTDDTVGAGDPIDADTVADESATMFEWVDGDARRERR